MKTDELIQALSKETSPVRKVERPLVSFFRWLGIALLSLSAGFALFGVRSDLVEVLTTPEHALQSLLLLFLALSSALSAFLLSVPDRHGRWVTAVPLTTIILWIAALVFSYLRAPSIIGGLGLTCVRDILALSIPPGAFLFLMLMRAAPLNPSRVGLLAMLAVGGLGALGSQFLCHNDDPLHLLLWHFLPVAILGAFGILLGRALLKWNKR